MLKCLEIFTVFFDDSLEIFIVLVYNFEMFIVFFV